MQEGVSEGRKKQGTNIIPSTIKINVLKINKKLGKYNFERVDKINNQ